MFNYKLLFCFLIFTLPLASSQVEVGNTNTNLNGVEIVVPSDFLTNVSNSSVNSSEFWDTNSLGPLNDANSTQFENSGGVLSILESWVDSLWCSLRGCTIIGNITIDGAGNNLEFTAPTGRFLRITGPEGASDSIYDTNQRHKFMTDNLQRFLIADSLITAFFDFQVNGETTLTNLTVSGELDMEQNNITNINNTCYNSDCSARIYYNGSGLVITS